MWGVVYHNSENRYYVYSQAAERKASMPPIFSVSSFHLAPDPITWNNATHILGYVFSPQFSLLENILQIVPEVGLLDDSKSGEVDKED